MASRARQISTAPQNKSYRNQFIRATLYHDNNKVLISSNTFPVMESQSTGPRGLPLRFPLLPLPRHHRPAKPPPGPRALHPRVPPFLRPNSTPHFSALSKTYGPIFRLASAPSSPWSSRPRPSPARFSATTDAVLAKRDVPLPPRVIAYGRL
ncbi:uncharacterized protein A4U43_C01F12270 [Asparagus officinalis]|uniref:Uncharacterized protein n=1 Tax=Asparagus officinalis TaxID=4686 RepID=A0A5P1FSI9_ASPOF|nr:uncharacterized protein A4U43_C01F12270 [Asparagus officinalis]